LKRLNPSQSKFIPGKNSIKYGKNTGWKYLRLCYLHSQLNLLNVNPVNMPTDFEIIAQFEQLYKHFRSNLNSEHDIQAAHQIYMELKKVRKKLTEAENNFFSLHVNPESKPKHSA
jgi:hypothetical protein